MNKVKSSWISLKNDWLSGCHGFARLAPQKIPNWITLRLFGQNKILKSSYFWFFFVPICAKLLQYLPDAVEVGLPDVMRPLNAGGLPRSEVSLSLSLPFTWQVMFFASVAFSIASIIFAWRCPPLIRDFVSPADFTEQGRSPFHIWHFVGEARKQELPQRLVGEGYVIQSQYRLSMRKKIYWHDTQAMSEFWSYHIPIDNVFKVQLINEDIEAHNRPDDMPEDECSIPDTPWHKPISDDHFKLLFHGARFEMQTMGTWSRFVCSVFYVLGFFAVFYLGCENIRSVWCITFR